jgi:hypothetical protein
MHTLKAGYARRSQRMHKVCIAQPSDWQRNAAREVTAWRELKAFCIGTRARRSSMLSCLAEQRTQRGSIKLSPWWRHVCELDRVPVNLGAPTPRCSVISEGAFVEPGFEVAVVRHCCLCCRNMLVVLLACDEWAQQLCSWPPPWKNVMRSGACVVRGELLSECGSRLQTRFLSVVSLSHQRNVFCEYVRPPPKQTCQGLHSLQHSSNS